MPQKVILIVDDAAEFTTLVGEILEQDGYKVVIAGSSYEALAAFGLEERIDLVLIDANLPGASGMELREALERLRPGVKLAYVTGMAGKPNGTDTPVLYKPFAPEAVSRLVKSLIGDA